MSFRMQRTRFLSIAPTIVIGILAAAAGVWLSRSFIARDATPVTQQATVVQPARPLPDLDLIDGTGARFTRANLEGRWSLLFFGFTHCPAICPNTLTLLQQANGLLADLPSELRPQLVFVSVDPERDTPAQMAEYVRFFGSGLRGVTGQPDRIAALTQALGIPVSRVDLPEGGYTVDHSAAILLVNPRGEFNALFSAPQTAAGLASDYRIIVEAST
jgi:protein SCO1